MKLVTKASNRGHTLSLVSRRSEATVPLLPSAVYHRADVFNVTQLTEILKGHDAVLSAYNSGWHNREIYTEFIIGALSIQKTTKQARVKRLLVVGGAGSLEISPGNQLLDSPDFPSEWKAGALAARDYLTILKKEQNLEWTYLSPAIKMHADTSGIRTGQYRTGFNTPVFNEKENPEFPLKI